MMTIMKSNNRQTKKDRWYLDIMSPNTKGEKFAWLDPTSIYINGDAFHDLLDDLVEGVRVAVGERALVLTNNEHVLHVLLKCLLERVEIH